MENKTENKIYSKLLEFQKKINSIKKDGKNPHFKSTYATLTQILSEVKPVLTECNLVLLQVINEQGVKSIVVDTETSEQIESFISLPVGMNAQQLGSAITYFRRYTLASLLALEIDDDDATTAVTPIKQQQATQGKPKCNDAIFTKAIDKIKAGDKSGIQKMIDAFDLSTEQLNVLQDYK